PEPEVAPPPSFPKTHVVRSGDTLSEIAEKYYRRQSLGSWLGQKNNTNAQSLQIGQELLIPSPPDPE
ncbi:MAG: LysM domain-containing protein, partial [Myxococcota bacterium]|nr:LysM domain-containing protein [Myxococcota bacterium]